MKVYIQQYGKERTGTNYLKALLAKNFDNIVLFDNRLGSKHEPFRAVSRWLRENRIDSLEAFEHLLRTDPTWKTRNTPSTDPFRWVHQPVSYEELVDLGNGSIPLRYIVQIKNPFAWAVSISRFARQGPGVSEQPLSVVPLNPLFITRQCLAFNAAYRSYWPLIESGRAELVRYEDLLEDAIPVLQLLGDRFCLSPRQEAFADVTTIVAPNTGVSTVPFDRSHYLDQDYRRALPAIARMAIARIIDWKLMRRYGYERDGQLSGSAAALF